MQFYWTLKCCKISQTVTEKLFLMSGKSSVQLLFEKQLHCFGHNVCRRYRIRACFPAPCSGSAFFCHSNMCINTSLVCNGIQNCVFPWDESNCKGKSVLLYCITVTCVILHNVCAGPPTSHSLECSRAPFM